MKMTKTMERNVCMFILYHKVLVKNQVIYTVKSRLSILMLDQREMCQHHNSHRQWEGEGDGRQWWR